MSHRGASLIIRVYLYERVLADDLVEDNERIPDLDKVLALQAYNQCLRDL